MELFLLSLHFFSIFIPTTGSRIACIHSELISKFLGRDTPGKLECDLFSLPVRLGGLGLFIPTVTATHDHQHNCSLHTSSPLLLVDMIVSQAHDAASCFATKFQLCSGLHATQQRVLEDFAKSIYALINSHQT